VVLANVAALEKLDMVRMADAETLLLSNALISGPQLNNDLRWRQRVLQARPPVVCFRGERGERSCLRPVSAGLSDPVQMACKAPGLFRRSFVELKGVGVRPGRIPTPHPYRSGLLSLHKAVDDYVKALLVQKLLQASGAGFSIVEPLAVIDTGLYLQEAGESQVPACILVREAHLRSPGSDLPKMGSLEQRWAFEAELILRYYGLTSADSQLQFTRQGGELGWGVGVIRAATNNEQVAWTKLVEAHRLELPFIADRVNIQMTWEPHVQKRSGFRLVDFGHYEPQMRFEDSLLSLVRDRPFAWGGVILPGSPHFVQPDADRRIQVERWKSTPFGATAEAIDRAVSPVAAELVDWLISEQPTAAEAHARVLQAVSSGAGEQTRRLQEDGAASARS